MSAGTYNISWYTYSDHLRQMLHEMMKTSKLTDVTLVCDDKRQFKAHKIVLSACSTIFKCIIDDLPQSSSVIYLKGIQQQEMESILQFMYLGEATIHQDKMKKFVKVARNLEIKDFEDEKVTFEEPEDDTKTKLQPRLINEEYDEKNSPNNQLLTTETSLKKSLSDETLSENQFTVKGISFTKEIESNQENGKHDCNQQYGQTWT